jgi:hypothetical protein
MSTKVLDRVYELQEMVRVQRAEKLMRMEERSRIQVGEVNRN